MEWLILQWLSFLLFIIIDLPCLKGELHIADAVPTEPEATISNPSKPLVSYFYSYLIFIHLGGRLVMHLIEKKTKGVNMQGIKTARPG